MTQNIDERQILINSTSDSMNKLGWTNDERVAFGQSHYGVASRRDMTNDQLKDFDARLRIELEQKNYADPPDNFDPPGVNDMENDPKKNNPPVIAPEETAKDEDYYVPTDDSNTQATPAGNLEEELNALVLQWEQTKKPFDQLLIEQRIFDWTKENGLNIKTTSHIADYLKRLKSYDLPDVRLGLSGSDYFLGVVEEEVALSPFLGKSGFGFVWGVSGSQKSSWVYYLAKCIAIKGFANWGEGIYLNGKVVIIQLEESPRVTRKRFLDVMDNPDFSNIIFMNAEISSKWQFSKIDVVEELIKEHKPQLVIIDSLSKGNRSSKGSQQDGSYADFIFDYQDLATKYDVTFLAVHHELKTAKMYAGTMKLRDNPDFVFHFEEDNEDRLLKVEKNRLIDDSNGKVFRFNLNFETNEWSYLGVDESESTDDTEKPLKEGDWLRYALELLINLQGNPADCSQIREYVAKRFIEDGRDKDDPTIYVRDMTIRSRLKGLVDNGKYDIEKIDGKNQWKITPKNSSDVGFTDTDKTSAINDEY